MVITCVNNVIFLQVQGFFESFIKKIKEPKLDGEQILQDPMSINKGIDITKKGSAYNVRLIFPILRIIKKEHILSSSQNL